MNDVMVDIETLNTAANSIVLSVAAVRFDRSKLDVFGETFHEHISIDSNIKYGRTFSESTVLWWFEQSLEARTAISRASRIPLEEAVLRLSKFIKRDDRIWGNGAAFDNAILSSMFKDVGIERPWLFRNDMCYRTLKELYPNVQKPEFIGVAHDALADAYYQAAHTQRIFARKNELEA
jgi:hypothetical protein